MRLSNAEKAKRQKERIAAQVRRAAGKGLDAAGIFLVSRLREITNVPAPRVKVISGPKSKHPGTVYYRATKPAIPGAPPRKLSGDLQKNLYYFVRTTHRGTVQLVLGSRARTIDRFPYPKYHEKFDPNKPKSGQHPFVKPTVNRYRTQTAVIVGKPLKTVQYG